MWVFGYGSLMWDGWEIKSNGKKVDKAILKNYKRSFNKKSEKNWGSKEKPGPTLGLEESTRESCVGSAFEFGEKLKENILRELINREGPSFSIVEKEIVLPNGIKVNAYTAVNDKNSSTYCGSLSIEDRAAMARIAEGSDGKCIDYVSNIKKKLEELNITDNNVNEFYILTIPTK